jgi:hypothetical protein
MFGFLLWLLVDVFHANMTGGLKRAACADFPLQ